MKYTVPVRAAAHASYKQMMNVNFRLAELYNEQQAAVQIGAERASG